MRQMNVPPGQPGGIELSVTDQELMQGDLRQDAWSGRNRVIDTKSIEKIAKFSG